MDFRGTAKETYQEVQRDDVSGLAAELAYRFFVAIFPFFIFVAALGGVVATIANIDNPTDQIMDQIGDTLPPDAASVLRDQLRGVVESQNTALLSIGFVSALWAASSGVRSLMKAVNRAYDCDEKRSFVKRYALSVGLTLLAGTFILVAFSVLVIGQFAVEGLVDRAGFGSAGRWAVSLARWPLALALLIGAMAFVYWAAPNRTLPFKWVSPGAVVFAVVWLLATFGLGIYVANFGAYNATYGTLGGVIILLLWFYITSYLMLVGAELNALLYRRERGETRGVDENAPSRTAALTNIQARRAS